LARLALRLLSALLLALYHCGPQPLRRLARWAWGGYVGPTIQAASGHQHPPVVAQAVVLRGSAVLLCMRESPRLWELPGGHVDPGETPQYAVVREVCEETGVHVQVIRQIALYDRRGFRPHLTPAFLCRPVRGEPRPRHEVLEARYVEVTRLPPNVFPWQRRAIHDALWLPVSAHAPMIVQRLGPGAVALSVLLHAAHWLARPRA
jgi:ADP-ribose pyrophosphatase YjhB (NUDIX family)